MKKPSALGPELYDKDYYLHSLPGIEYLEKTDALDPAITETLKFGQIKPGQHVLDFGCGRGTLVIALAQDSASVGSVGTASGVVMSLHYVSAVVAPLVAAQLIASTGDMILSMILTSSVPLVVYGSLIAIVPEKPRI